MTCGIYRKKNILKSLYGFNSLKLNILKLEKKIILCISISVALLSSFFLPSDFTLYESLNLFTPLLEVLRTELRSALKEWISQKEMNDKYTT